MQQKVMSATEIAAMQQQLNSPVAAAASSNGHNRRILKEFKSLMDEPVEGISCYITAGNIHFWKVTNVGIFLRLTFVSAYSGGAKGHALLFG